MLCLELTDGFIAGDDAREEALPFREGLAGNDGRVGGEAVLEGVVADSGLTFGSVRPSLSHWYEVRCDAERQTSTGCHSFEKLFWSFGLWDYGEILELHYF